MKKLSIKLAALLCVCLGTSFSVSLLASEKLDAEIAERLKPVGEVCIAGDPCAAAAVASTSSGPRTGEELYNKFCTACHGMGVAGAPKYGDLSAWQPRIDKGLEALYASSKNGIGAMPPGLCMSCSDEEIESAVTYMVEATK